MVQLCGGLEGEAGCAAAGCHLSQCRSVPILQPASVPHSSSFFTFKIIPNAALTEQFSSWSVSAIAFRDPSSSSMQAAMPATKGVAWEGPRERGKGVRSRAVGAVDGNLPICEQLHAGAIIGEGSEMEGAVHSTHREAARRIRHALVAGIVAIIAGRNEHLQLLPHQCSDGAVQYGVDHLQPHADAHQCRPIQASLVHILQAVQKV